MRLLDRYLLRELLFPLGVCLSGFLIFWISFNLFDDLGEFERLKLHGLDVAEYYLFKVPEFLVFPLGPIALLFAVLYALTNHARHNELTAMRAAGLGLWRLAMPYLAVAVLLSVGLFALNELWVPRGAEAAEDVLHRRLPQATNSLSRDWVRNLSFRSTRDDRNWVIPAYNKETHEMIAPHVDWTLPDGSGREIEADRGARTGGVWTFYNVRERFIPRESAGFPFERQTNVLAAAEFTETPDEIRSEIKASKIKINSLKEAKKAQLSIREILDYRRLHPERSARRAQLDTILHGRLAAPWTCVVVVVIALPFATGSGRRNAFVGVASSILICFVFLILQQLALATGIGGFLPPWLAAWTPNLLFALGGIWLTQRVR
ncbi:MAG TPA: LptF/LptG family permease [Verrucomicrobiae bacterium]|jgi:lipopolysaccharide export system permease protein